MVSVSEISLKLKPTHEALPAHGSMFAAHRFTSCGVDGFNLTHDFSSYAQSYSLNKLSTLQPCHLPSTLQTYLFLLKAVSFS